LERVSVAVAEGGDTFRAGCKLWFGGASRASARTAATGEFFCLRTSILTFVLLEAIPWTLRYVALACAQCNGRGSVHSRHARCCSRMQVAYAHARREAETRKRMTPATRREKCSEKRDSRFVKLALFVHKRVAPARGAFRDGKRELGIFPTLR
jgi:hypothetical protein